MSEDHSHGPEAAMSEEADPLYQPLSGIESWAPAPVDQPGWADAVDRLHRARDEDPDWAAMVDRNMLLAAAHQSAALDGMYPVDRDVAVGLLLGRTTLGAVDEQTRTHVRANVEALGLARHVDVSEDSIRRIHEVACRPQVTHSVRVDGRQQDHVLAAGDYKHHPNHIRDGDGQWHPTAPVARVQDEVATLVAEVHGPAFAGLHPAEQAGYLLYAMDHVQPFADGNGRVARALAGGCLLRAVGIPYLPLDDDTVDIHGAVVTLVDLLTSASREGPALERWRAQEAAGAALMRRLEPAVTEALERYNRRAERRADLSEAIVVPCADAITIRAAVDEVISVDAHRAEGEGPPLLIAVEAGLRLEAEPGTDLDAWLDRVVPILALRVAAELE